jgi:L-ribulokinase
MGVDYGTNSVRAVVVDCADGRVAGTSVFEYPSGEAGVVLDPRDPNLARQRPGDYQKGFVESVRGALKEAGVSDVVGIGTDTTGSSPLPLDASGVPLGVNDDHPAAQCWLWKDHTSVAEAEEITEKAEAMGRPFLRKTGGAYSSEWFWAKILHCARVAPKVFGRAHTWTECQDYIPAWATGTETAMKRGVCAAGHKGLFSRDWGGLPDKEFLAALDPRLADLRDRLYDDCQAIGEVAGGLRADLAGQVGLTAGTKVSVGAMDAHLGAVGVGIKPGAMVKIMGTSTCDIMVGGADTPDIEGVCGVVPGSVIPGMIGIEAGQSAVGDLFAWAARLTGRGHEELTRDAAALRPGESGLLALDWNNGNRTILVDQALTGLIVGQTLASSPAEVYRAMIEATAFGSLKIIEQIEASGVPITEVVASGGIAEKSPLTMQIYADICNRPIKVPPAAQSCALGSAMAGAVAGSVYATISEAQAAMAPTGGQVFKPNPAAVAVYQRMYRLYVDLHDAFGRSEARLDMSGLMKELIRIRTAARN